VTDSVDPEQFVREFLEAFLESELLDGALTTPEYHEQVSEIRRAEWTGFCRDLFALTPKAVEGPLGPCRLFYLREADGSQFPFLQMLKKDAAPERRRLSCFVGHRFLKGIERSLRFNLVHMLEPHGVTLRWSGYDLSSRDIFRGIVDGIRESDLCIFDNLGTLNRPNVYIEIGIAHALGKPMLVCEYVGRKRRVLDTGSVPSDLQGLFRIQYRTYEDLCRQLYFGLPAFLHSNALR
jgi:hypothetical protein